MVLIEQRVIFTFFFFPKISGLKFFHLFIYSYRYAKEIYTSLFFLLPLKGLHLYWLSAEWG